MINIYKLNVNDSKKCTELINMEMEDSKYFRELGWSKKQITSQFNKKINYSFGAFYKKKLLAFIIGDLISIEKVSEYEILFLYVKKTHRRKGLANQLVDYCSNLENKIKLKKIFLEVSKENKVAIKLYEKNDFKLIDIRKKYYENDNKKIDAFCYALNLW